MLHSSQAAPAPFPAVQPRVCFTLHLEHNHHPCPACNIKLQPRVQDPGTHGNDTAGASPAPPPTMSRPDHLTVRSPFLHWHEPRPAPLHIATTELQLWVQDASPDGNDTAGASPPPAAPAMEAVKKTRRKLLKLPLKLGGPGFLYPGMTDAQRKVCLL